MNARETLAAMIRTDRDSTTVWSPSEVRAAFHAYQAEVLHEAARLMEQAGYDDDAINWLDTYADYDPAGEAVTQ